MNRLTSKEKVSWQYWAKPKQARVNHGEAWWYAIETGHIELRVADGAVLFTVRLPYRQVRHFVDAIAARRLR